MENFEKGLKRKKLREIVFYEDFDDYSGRRATHSL